MHRAFDEIRFGRARTLDLRTSLPTAIEAEERAESWLRERQASAGGDVLIITGRGRGSEGGVAVVRPAVQRRLARLRRQGVITEAREHSPGSFVVTLASLRTLLGASRRAKDPLHRPPKDPAALSALQPATRAILRDLAVRSLEQLGAPRTEGLVEDEMMRQFSRLTRSVGNAPDREARLCKAASAALEEISEG